MDRLDDIRRFFKADASIKKTMYDLAPLEYMSSDECIDYSNNMYNALRDLKFEMVRQAETFFPSIRNNIETKMNDLMADFVECGTSYQNLKNFYNTRISDLSPDYVTEVGANSAGFTGGWGREGIILKANSLNEMLHSMHSFIMCNESLYSSSHFIGEKGEKDTCSFYGNETNMMLSLRETLNLDSSRIGDIQGLSMDDKLIMMIRDKGHATTIDVDFSEDKVLVSYHIPKLCNVEMISNLPGINKIDNENNYATGQFEVSREDLNLTMLSFIYNIPEDGDMCMRDMNGNYEDRTKHFEFVDILNDLELKDVAKIYKQNPSLYEMEGGKEYLESRIQLENEHINSLYQVIQGQISANDKTFSDFVQAFGETDVCKQMGHTRWSLTRLTENHSQDAIVNDIKIILSKPENQESLQQFQNNITEIVNERKEGIKELTNIVENGIEKEKHEELNLS